MASLSLRQKWRLSAALRIDWYFTMAALIGDGMPLESILRAMRGEFARAGHPLAPLVSELMLRIRGGGTRVPAGSGSTRRTLGTELTGLVPVNEAMLIDAGESSGDLGRGFVRAAEYLQSTSRLRSEILAPLIEPCLLMAMLLGVLLFFSVQVLPTLAEISPRARWPLTARMYGALADKALVVVVLVLLLLVGGTLAFLRSAEVWSGPLRSAMDRSIWPWTLLARVNSASMFVSLSGFVAAGVPFDTAVRQLQANANGYMKRIYESLREGLRNGMPAHDALCALSLVGGDCHWVLRLYGGSSDFAGAMARLADQMMALATRKVRSIFRLISLLLKMLVAGFVVWTLVSMFGVVGSVRSNGIAFHPTVSHSTERGASS